ncbi:hypothetical protein [Neobacillus sp. GCM10023253]|uniref:hypothetical protein n=1 Tax=Neobacillus sp. GCM10023253 TaxID=3252644 RepID=UPI00366DB49B
MKLSLGKISITNISDSSGVFFGKKNTHKKFHSDTTINEVIGTLSGNENTLTHGYWIKTKGRKDE